MTHLISRTLGLPACVVAATLLIGALGSMASAQSIRTVMNTNDSGAGSMREAITGASSGDTIQFDASIFSGGTATISVLATISVVQPVIIEGPDAASGNRLTLDGGGTTRIFLVSATGQTTIRNIHFTRGYSSQGGAIWSRNYSGVDLTIEDCAFTNNNATSFGGAMFIESVSALTIRRSLFFDNQASTHGGGVAITNVDSEIVNCTFVDNDAVGSEGGGIWRNQGGGFIVAVRYSVFIGNTSFATGPAICNKHYNNYGIGPDNHSGLELEGCMFQNNVRGSTGLNEPVNTFTTVGYNMFDDVYRASYIRPGDPSPSGSWPGRTGITENTGDQFYSTEPSAPAASNPQPNLGLDPMGLADNGGLWDSVALQAMSDAIDAGDPASTLTVDGRNITRNVGTVDIGPYEFGAPNTPPMVTATTGLTGTGPYVVEVPQGADFAASIEMSDPNGDVVDVTAVTAPSTVPTGMTIPMTGNNGTDTLTVNFAGPIPIDTATGDYTFTIEFSDGIGAAQTFDVTVRVTPNVLPTITMIPEELEEMAESPYVLEVTKGREFSFDFVATDADGDVVTIVGLTGPGSDLMGMTVEPMMTDSGTGTLTMTFEGPVDLSVVEGQYSYEITLSDGVALDTVTFTVTLDVIAPLLPSTGNSCAPSATGEIDPTLPIGLLLALCTLGLIRRRAI